MAVTINGDGLVDVGGTSTSQGRVRLAEDTDNGANYIELTAPASVASNQVITFPDETGTVLTSASAATQANQETATSTTTYVSPGRQQYHPSAAKAWGTASGNGTSLLASYNVTSITDGGTGDITFTYTTNFSSANYSVVGSAEQTGAGYWIYPYTHAINNARFLNINASGTQVDPAGPYSFAAFGDQ